MQGEIPDLPNDSYNRWRHNGLVCEECKDRYAAIRRHCI